MKVLSECGNIEGKKVLLRCDLNVPLDKEGNISDNSRIVAAIPSIKLLLDKKAALIVVSHFGRPKSAYEAKYSMAKLVEPIAKLSGSSCKLVESIEDADIKAAVAALKPGEILLLENIRFFEGETSGDEDLAKRLASYADIYVNDAFGAAHRAHSSTAVCAKYFTEKYAGLLMQKEVENLEILLHKAQKPYTAIVGGSKVSSKIDILKNLIDRVDDLIIGGAMAYTFIKAKGGEIGKSLCEDDKLDVAKEVMSLCEAKGVRLHLPIDTVAASEISESANIKECDTMAIPSDMCGVDIGKKAIEAFGDIVGKSKTILWNGPVGVFEVEKFSCGTLEIGKAVCAATRLGAYSAVGGGDSVAAANALGIAQELSYVSTGGGAMLEYLEGKTLPGIAALN